VDFDVQLLLGGGSYNVSVAVVDDALHSSHLDWIDQAVVFQVMPDGVPDFAGLTPLPASLSYGLGPGTVEEPERQAASQMSDKVAAGD
jgi:lipopolysaccharide transport system ATP-binding protein